MSAGAPSQWRDESTDIVRAASGGMLFGIPMLFTMEVWWLGSHTTAAQALGMLVVTAAPVVVLNQTSGFRGSRDVRLRDAVMDTVEALALGIVLVTAVLVVMRRITGDTPLAESVTMVVYEAFPFCLGIAVANHFLRGGRNGGDDDDEGPDTRRGRGAATVADLGATAVGAVFISLNIAVTDEVPMVATAMDSVWLLGVVATSVLVSYGIVFAAGFARQDERHQQEGPFQRPITETVVCYLVALGAAVLMLWLFQRLHGPWHASLVQVVVLGLPASVGGAAGRLAI